jgi:hypothetical protein
MAGLVPAIHVFLGTKTWMPGTRPGMTKEDIERFKWDSLPPTPPP